MFDAVQGFGLRAGARVVVEGRVLIFGTCVAARNPSSLWDLRFDDEATKGPITMTIRQFEGLFADGEVRILAERERVTDVAPSPDGRFDQRAEMLAYYCRRFDEAGDVTLSTGALDDFIAEQKSEAPFDRAPSPGSLRRALGKTTPGDRRARLLQDGRRLGKSHRRMPAVVRAIMQDEIEKHWDDISVNQVAVWSNCGRRIVELNQQRELDGRKPLGIPSESTISRTIKAQRDEVNVARREGKGRANQIFGAIKGSATAKRALDLVQIDHTQLDVYVVDDELFMPMGKPWLTVAFDVHTRYPTAVICGFKQPSVETVSAALRQTVRPKTFINEMYPDIDGEWVAWGLPSEIHIDNALEMTGSSLRDACADAGISIRYSPVGTPQNKGMIERFNRTINQMLVHRLPGSLPFTPQERAKLGIEPDTYACLRLSDLMELIYHCVIEVYGRETHTGTGVAPEQAWRRSVSSDADFHPYVHDLRAFDLALAKLAQDRVLTVKGIEMFGGLVYRDAIAVRQLLNDLEPLQPMRNRRRGSVSVKVKYHPEDISQISVWNEKDRDYVTLPCIDDDVCGLSEHHHVKLREFAKAERLAFTTKSERLIARARLNDKIKAMMPAARIRVRSQAAALAPRKYGDVPQISADLAPNMLPVAPLSDRTGGEVPHRAPKAKARTRPVPDGVRRRREIEARSPKEKSEPKAPSAAGFDGVDWDALKASPNGSGAHG